MYVCFKQDLKRNVSYVGNTDTMAIGYVEEIINISDTVDEELVKELDEDMTVKLMKEGLCDVRRIVRKNGHLLQNNLKSIRNRLKKLKNCQKQP